ncbi:GNAT family N-acetyltransferase [Enterococcus sp. MJM16]|uniref:GNAT family N-acetyltransferase n=1 Tax=Candidatus Enterococcus murrayae TaxID=2815321 RepID=A0ABS3HBR5_9ENTE|nr:GNAT family N-acetyltransferase [Enterococcus sp. MJM16]
MKGEKIDLFPAELADRQKIYEWCFQSETTKSHSGPPDYPEKAIATFQEFCEEYYEDYYFTGAHPERGRGFLIKSDREAVGFISYSAFHLNSFSAELDIWMKDEANCGKGYGNDVIRTLSNYLHEEMRIDLLLIAPSNRNIRAIKSYEKAGFKRTNKSMNTFLTEEYQLKYGTGDYGIAGTAIMIKYFAQ